ncbi:GNAT family N-acetyltransferase [Rhodococcus chondri]|uniref:N-acetyltransferase n=1 Tax=Rhodococcus chondri TaxID=3065941 RepID=A0ABU7JPU8_9NOCA|nr:N-acetyltransferase [Rhodococcus sp. CC-R104]MEE2032055.1 N-acetyltransferase [Rhodococcus sp. CC-R104]
MLIRREHPSDHDAIAEVHRAAFASVAPPGRGPVEPGLVDALRAGSGGAGASTASAWLPPLSLVAENSSGSVVGHVCASRADLSGEPVLALGPIGVVPDRWRTGIGSALMHAVLGAADALDESVIVLLGHLGYYPRFGFVPAAELGITVDVPEWGSHLQARALTAYRPDLRGEFRYAAPFYEIP